VAMQDWIHRYPQIERLLQQGPDEDLCYDANTGEVEVPHCALRQTGILDDEEYRSALRQLTQEIAQQQEALDGLVLVEVEAFRQALTLLPATGADPGGDTGVAFRVGDR
jgi:hypothetical protein